jgi:hypothetical protein
MNINMEILRHSLRRMAAGGALVAAFLLLFSVEGRGQCCCTECPNGALIYDPELCAESGPCIPENCPECNTAIPLTDHLWVLAVLGAAGGAWMLMRKRTEGDLA